MRDEMLEMEKNVNYIKLFLRRYQLMLSPFYKDIIKIGENWHLKFNNEQRKKLRDAINKLNSFHKQLLFAELDSGIEIDPLSKHSDQYILISRNDVAYNLKRIPDYTKISQIYYGRNKLLRNRQYKTEKENYERKMEEEREEEEQLDREMEEKINNYDWGTAGFTEDSDFSIENSDLSEDLSFE